MNNQYICKSVENKIIKLLKPNNNDRMIAKKLAYVREHLDLMDYIGYDDLIIELDDLNECVSCNELFKDEDCIDTETLVNGGYGIACHQCYSDGN